MTSPRLCVHSLGPSGVGSGSGPVARGTCKGISGRPYEGPESGTPTEDPDPSPAMS